MGGNIEGGEERKVEREREREEGREEDTGEERKRGEKASESNYMEKKDKVKVRGKGRSGGGKKG